MLAVRVTCHCWPVRTFGNWVLCGSPSAGQQALITVAGPLINVALFLTGWSLLNVENSVEEHSVGVALFFAAMPWPNLVAAFTGGGDITTFVRWIQRHGPKSNHTLATGIGLIVQLLIILPAIGAGLSAAAGLQGEADRIPAVAPAARLVSAVMVRTAEPLVYRARNGSVDAYAYVGAWSFVAAVGFFLTRRQLKGLIRELSL